MPFDTRPPAPQREMPVWAWSEFDSLGKVKSAIRNLEQGQFAEAALLCDAMMRDDRIAGAMLTRTEAIPALPFNFEEGTGAKAKQVLDALEGTKLFETMCPDAALIELQKWDKFIGIAVAENVWDGWTPKLRVWHPRWLYWRDDTRSYWLMTEREPIEVKPGNAQWVVLASHGIERAWMNGLVRSLYVPWLVRQWGLRDWARHSEVLGSPVKKAYVPTGGEEEDKKRFISEVANMGANAVVRIPKGVEGTPQFELELMEASASNGEGFDRLLAKADACLTLRIQGQNLTSEVKGGSFAAAKVHENIRADVLQSDAEALSPCLREQVLAPWAFFNFGAGIDEVPTPCWNTDPPEDKQVEALALKTLGEAIQVLQAVGAKPDVDELLEHWEVPTTGPAGEPPAPAQPAPGAFGRLGTGPGRAPVALASQNGVQRATPAELEGQQYADEMVTQLAGEGNRAVSPMLAALLDCLNNAQSYQDLEQRVASAFARMDASELAHLQQKAFILAELSGRLAVLEDV